MRTQIAVVGTLLGLTAPPLIHAAKWQVPEFFPDIGTALTAKNHQGEFYVQTGDEIEVGPGTYPPFVLRKPGWSRERSDASALYIHSSQGPEVTIIDARGTNAHVITVQQPDNIIEGFTVQNGYGEVDSGHGYGVPTGVGISVYPSGSSTVLRNLIVRSNNLAGVAIGSGAPSCTVQNSEICFNHNLVSRMRGDAIGVYMLGENGRARNLNVHDNDAGVAVGNYPSQILGGGVGNRISDSAIHHNRGFPGGNCGIIIWYKAADTAVTDNFIFQNLGSGLWDNGTNTFAYNNAFTGNGQFLLPPLRNAQAGFWSQFNLVKTPGRNIIGGSFLGGNYYDDYGGQDTDGDGLGDTDLPHAPSSPGASGQRAGDYHPLVGALGDLVLNSVECSKSAELVLAGGLPEIPAQAVVSLKADRPMNHVPVALRINDSQVDQSVIDQILPDQPVTVNLRWRVTEWWAAGLRNLVARANNGRLEAQTNLRVRVIVDPTGALPETDKTNNELPPKSLALTVVPDVALGRMEIVQVIGKPPFLVGDKPVMLRVQPKIEGLSSQVFSEIHDVSVKVSFSDANPPQTLAGLSFFQKLGKVYVVPGGEAAKIRTALAGGGNQVEGWIFSQGADAINFLHDRTNRTPRPRAPDGGYLAATAEFQVADAWGGNNRTNISRMVYRGRRPVYQIYYRAVDYGILRSHKNTVQQDLELIDRHSRFLKSIFPIVDVYAFYADDQPDRSKPPADPYTIVGYLSLPGLAYAGGSFRDTWDSTVYIVPGGFFGEGIAGMAFPNIGWGVFVDERFRGASHLTAHEISHTWGARDAYSGDDYALHVAADGWDAGGEAEPFPGGPRLTLTSEKGGTDRNWWTHMGDHRNPRPWVTQADCNLLLYKIVHGINPPDFSQKTSRSITLAGLHQAPTVARLLQVGGQVNPDGSMELWPCHERVGLPDPIAPGEYSVECLDADGLALQPPTPFQASGEAGGNPLNTEGYKFFGFNLACPEATARWVFKQGETVLAERRRSPHPPELRDLMVSATGNDAYRLRWSALDADDDRLNFQLQYSRDGEFWLPLQRAIEQTGESYSFQFPITALPGGDACRIRVMATDGLNATWADSPPFQVPAKPPTATITLPDEGASYLTGQEVQFAGFGYDPDEGMLEAMTFQWGSDRDGLLAHSVSSHRISSLSPGAHLITLSVENRAGQRAQTTRRVRIGSLALKPSRAAFDAQGGTGMVEVLTLDHQPWQATASAGWLQSAAFVTHQTAIQLTYSVLPNHRVEARTGAIRIGDLDHSVKQAGRVDADGNGFPDEWERQYVVPSPTPTSDFDGDGSTDLQECWAGTDPRDPNSHFRVLAAKIGAPTDWRVGLSWDSAPARVYQLLFATHPAGPYQVAADDLMASPPRNDFSIPIVPGPAAGFYRVHLKY